MTSDECPYNNCDGSGLNHIRDTETNQEFMAICKCFKEKKRERELHEISKIPSEFVGATINSFEVENFYGDDVDSLEKAMSAKLVAGNFVQHFDKMKEQGTGLYLFSSEKGSGKTRLACSIANALNKLYDVTVHFTTTVDLLDNIRYTFDNDSKYSTAEVTNMYRNVEVLILDDIGLEKVNDWVVEKFTAILNERMNNKKITIFTSNYKIEELNFEVITTGNSKRGNVDHKTARIISRLMVLPVELPNVNIRKRNLEEEKKKVLELLLPTSPIKKK